MEYIENKIFSHLENHVGLDQNLIILKRKLEELNGVKEDNESIKSVELQPRKKLRKAVEIWFQNVERINSEILNLDNKARETNVVSVSRGFLGAEVSTKTKEVEELIDKGKSFNGLVIDEPRWIGQSLSTTTLFGEVPNNVMNEIWEHLMDDDVSKIGVWGMGGVGKTTIMKLINNQLLKETEKFDKVIWITVSKELNIARLQNGIARAMGVALLEDDDEAVRAGKLFERMAQNDKYVLILDDVWNTFSLEEVGIPEPSNGSKIVITTRSLDVCQYFGAKEVRLLTLSRQDARNLFLQKVGEDVLDHPHLLPIVESVAEECDGLPLAIVTIASSMKGVRNIHEWRNALNELRRCVQSVNGENEKIFQRLQFSYDRLEDEKVKYCFLYLSLYPEDREVKKVKLIEKWIEEGFVEEMDSMQEEIDKGHTIMNRLINNCLFLTSRSGDFVSLHDLMRDMALRITSARPRFLVKAGMQLKQIPAVQEWTEDLEKVSFMENWGIGIPSNMSPPKCGMLTTLLLGSCQIESIPESFFKHMRGLKVLDLSNNLIESVPTSIINLKDLTTLLLGSCHIESIPESFFKHMRGLKVLDLSNNLIESVPTSIINLKDLTTLLLGSCHIESIPESFFEHMRGLKVLDLSNNRIQRVPTSIVNLKDLTVLLLNNCNNLKRLPSFSNLQALKKLNLENTEIKDVPHGLERLVNLQHLDLRKTGITTVADGLLAKLTSLRSLQIVNFGQKSFPSVNGEEIGGLKKLECFEGRFCELGELHHYVQAVCAPTIRPSQYVIFVGNDPFYNMGDSGQPIDTLKAIDIGRVHIPTDGVKILSDIEVLRIESCIADSLYEEETFCSCLKPVPPNDIFSSLSCIEVFYIKKIKKLFSFNWMMQNLRHLHKLCVRGCDEMEEIIASESDAEEEGMGTIQFALPRLKTLALFDLPRLKSVCSANRVMVCDSIKWITIWDCPKLKRMPLYLPLHDDGQPSPPPLSDIRISENEWDMMEWYHTCWSPS